MGYIFFEVPDCERSLKAFDYPMIWEQHKVYFTNYTFNATLKIFNFKKIFSGLAKYKYEDCLLYIGKLNDFENIKNKTSKKKLQKEINTAQKFFSKFKVFKNKIFLFFKNLKKNNVNIALYGGGHKE